MPKTHVHAAKVWITVINFLKQCAQIFERKKQSETINPLPFTIRSLFSIFYYSLQLFITEKIDLIQ